MQIWRILVTLQNFFRINKKLIFITMGYKIFLDDERMPDWVYDTNNSDWVIVRNLTDFKNTILEKGLPDFISFDNDLGASMEEGKDAAKWMVYDMEFDISNMEYKSHSANSGGPGGPKGDIVTLLNNWKKFLNRKKEDMNENKIRSQVRKVLINTYGKPFCAALKESQEIRMKFNIPIPGDIIKIKNLLKAKGHKLFVVGGAVRDALLGKTPKDYDLATDAVPDVIQSILHPYYRTLETGKAFGVINVITPEGEYEIATFRKDAYKEKPELEGFKQYLKATNPIKYQEFMKMLMK